MSQALCKAPSPLCKGLGRAAGAARNRKAHLITTSQMRSFKLDSFDADQIIGGEWAPTLSWTLPAHPVANKQAPTPPAGHASEEDSYEPGNVLAGQWDARSNALVNYEEVMKHYYDMKHPKKSSK